MKIFVDADADVRLARRIRRDMAERGRVASVVVAWKAAQNLRDSSTLRTLKFTTLRVDFPIPTFLLPGTLSGLICLSTKVRP